MSPRPAPNPARPPTAPRAQCRPPGQRLWPSRRQRGAALLAAMLTVTLVATLAAGALWQQWRAVEVESAERTRVQSNWILTGALDWSRLILREDAIAGGPDSLSEPWSIPLQEARLSTFLAADQNNNAGDDIDALDAFLAGSITDQQGRLNVSNLVENQQLQPAAHRAFAKLFDLLSLPAAQLSTLEQNLVLAQKGSDSQALLPAQRVDQLLHYGLTASTLSQLRPFITVLPEKTPVNLNTAPVEVLYASIRSLDMASAQRLVKLRARSHFKSLSDVGQQLGELAAQVNENEHSVNSRYFEVLGRLRLGDNRLEERSLVRRNNTEVQTVWRERNPSPSLPASAQTP
ncbi:type II secretion system minor pseudopilin GspK [Curvibacter sp. HBC61]|uniref:Type II secretion system protein K n=1 Tax=Curvibacter cyanobacteriorum TaxID=3026422 RepID=A0ABT5MZ37_9BURK|nr:type II secretion system minor pseudopilin GspK [Curvibacter sp. HBC61]MDD0839068.1 type II secretion system minor pseudopilin GspK [Curvibacter sp. HBC61]